MSQLLLIAGNVECLCNFRNDGQFHTLEVVYYWDVHDFYWAERNSEFLVILSLYD